MNGDRQTVSVHPRLFNRPDLWSGLAVQYPQPEEILPTSLVCNRPAQAASQIGISLVKQLLQSTDIMTKMTPGIGVLSH